jgi:Skp family chaperone for outer membrane proteins
MAETSGFFDAEWDDTLLAYDGSQGDYDRRYLASQWAEYFNKFICNGVYGNPTNQCRVRPGSGLSVIVSSGNAFINGYWYTNDEDLTLTIPTNNSGSSRTDSVRLRFDDTKRTITAQVFSGDVDNVRNDIYYDLKIAEIIVKSGDIEISASNITDTRTDENVCGFVTGLLEVQTTKDLFAQYQAIFDEWFDETKGQLSGDLAIKIQTEFEQINTDIQQYHTDTENAFDTIENDIKTYQTNTETKIDEYQTNVTNTVNEYKTQVDNSESEYKTQVSEIANNAYNKINDFVDDDYVIAQQKLTFTDKVCTITDSKITADTLVDVYFTKDTIKEATKSIIYADTEEGKIILTADRQPESDIYATIRVRVR